MKAISSLCVEDSFTQLLEELAHKYFEHFEDNEDNKLEYTKYFNEYVRVAHVTNVLDTCY